MSDSPFAAVLPLRDELLLRWRLGLARLGVPGCWPSPRYSTLSAVSSMKAASSEARTTVSSCSRTPCSNAMSPTCAATRPDTISAPSAPLTALPPASATALASRSGWGVATRTVCPELRAMNSSMVHSASSWPRPITIR